MKDNKANNRPNNRPNNSSSRPNNSSNRSNNSNYSNNSKNSNNAKNSSKSNDKINSKINSKSNNKNNNKNQSKDNKNTTLTVLKFTGIVLFFVILSVVTSIAMWLYLGKNATYTPTPSNPLGEYSEESLVDIPRHTNIFIAGVDAETGTLTDFMMVGSYDKDTGEIDFINIPRDTACTLNDELRAKTEAEGIYVPNTIKLNGLHSYTKDMGMEFLTEYQEDLLGIEIQYYVLVDLNILHNLIDNMGGVWFDVPQEMKYTDRAQGLYIDLQPGYQLLDADQCEQLLRYRHGYARGDIARIEVQQAFMKAMMEQLLSLDSFLSNPAGFISTVFTNVETNATPMDVARYAQEIPKISANNITFQTAPIASIETYVYLDDYELAKLVDKIFFDIEPEPEVPEGTEGTDGAIDGTGTTKTP